MRQVVLLRGVNVGGRNRLAMPALRAALEQAGMEDVATYVQSGNVVLDSAAKPDALARACSEVIAGEDEARAWGRVGRAIAERVTWDRAIDRVLELA